MDSEKVDRIIRAGILGLILGILIYAPVAIGAVLTAGLMFVRAMLVAALALWILRIIINKKYHLLWTPACWGVIAFTIYASIRYYSADIEYVARQELVQIIFYTALFFVVLNNLHRRRYIPIIASVLIALGTIISLYAIYQYMTKTGKVLIYPKPEQYIGRASGTYICPNHFAGFLAMLLPLTLSYLIAGRVSYTGKIFLGYAWLVMAAGLVTTVSRAGWFSAAVGIVATVFVLLHNRRFWLPATLAIIALVFAGLILYSQSYSAKKRVQENRISVSDENRRIFYWRGAIRIWESSPLFGYGSGHYDYRYRQVREAHNCTQGRPGWAHNDYLNTLADYGLAGLLIILSTLGTIAYSIVKSWRHLKRSDPTKATNKSALALGFSTGLIALAVHSFFDFNMHIPANAIIAVVFMALLSSYWRYYTDKCWIELNTYGKVFAIVSIAYIGANIAYFSLQKYDEEKLIQAAKSAYTEADALSYFQKAFEIEPWNPETAYLAGEMLRLKVWESGEENKELIIKAMEWYKRAMDLNPLDPYPYLRYGMCLHWIKKHHAAKTFFERAIQLDPNSYYMLAHLGWHYFQLEDYKNAKEMFTRSIKLNWWDNPIAAFYLRIIEERKLY